MSDLEPDEVELRRAARERALELLYEAEIKGTDVEDLLAELPVVPSDLTGELVRGVAADREKIDARLTDRVAPRWTLARLAAVDRAILRLASYELLHRTDRSQAVILNEAVVLARRFGTDDSPRFVNGVLSAVAADVRSDAPAGGETDTEAEPAADESAASPSRAPEVDGVVFDLDGVIRHWDEESLDEAERTYGLPAGTIRKAAFDHDHFGEAMRGTLLADQWARRIGETIAADHPDADPVALAETFAAVGWRIDEEVVDLVRQVRRKVPVVLLSNASSRLLHDLRLSGLSDVFDAVVGSAELGVTKPHPRAFAAAADRLRVPLDRCLLVDDTVDNVSAARALGMRAVQFGSADDLSVQLASLGLLDT